jgi:hypothetical protein
MFHVAGASGAEANSARLTMRSFSGDGDLDFSFFTARWPCCWLPVLEYPQIDPGRGRLAQRHRPIRCPVRQKRKDTRADDHGNRGRSMPRKYPTNFQRDARSHRTYSKINQWRTVKCNYLGFKPISLCAMLLNAENRASRFANVSDGRSDARSRVSRRSLTIVRTRKPQLPAATAANAGLTRPSAG